MCCCFCWGEVTFWDFGDMLNLKTLHVCSFLLIFAHTCSEKPILGDKFISLYVHIYIYIYIYILLLGVAYACDTMFDLQTVSELS